MHVFEEINTHLSKQIPFVCYVKPNENVWNLLVHQNDEIIDFIGQAGFVFMPFHEGKQVVIPFEGNSFSQKNLEKLEQKSTHLKHKKAELNDIMAETQKEEAFLIEKSAEYEAQIEERLLAAYKRIRKSVINGLAVVSIERGASAGSFFTIPPQKQMEIAQRKKIIIDEHSGKILVDDELVMEENEKMASIIKF